MSRTIRIGTRDSKLALWQANTVAQKLNNLGFSTEIIAVKSEGDIVLDKPLYEMGITGIFTKTLDIAMLTNKVDIAVHSMKDVPTALPNGIVQAAVLERAEITDILVHKGNLNFFSTEGTIATGSLRRKAQWLNRYPNHKVEDLRGNVITRLEKLENNDWDGAIFAAAGLERLGIRPENSINLDWMIPAPAQGAMLVVAMENDQFALDALAELNHKPTEIETFVERQFLRTLEGGCTAPIGASANYDKENGTIDFIGCLFSLDGTEKHSIEQTAEINNWETMGKDCAYKILNEGGNVLMTKLREQLKK